MKWRNGKRAEGRDVGVPDFNNDGKVEMGEGMASLMMLGYLEDSEQEGLNGGPDEQSYARASKSSAPSKSRGFVVLVALAAVALVALLVFALSSAAPTSSKNTQGASTSNNTYHAATSSNASVTNANANANANTATNANSAAAVTAADVADGLPYKGMSAALIDETWLGPHDSESTVTIDRTNNKFEKGTYQLYIWRSKNGKDDAVFTAYVKDGQVAGVVKNLSGTDYWPTAHGFPDLYASGTAKGKVSSSRPDPADYDDPDDFADDLLEWQKDTGNTSSEYDDPYDEWELDH